MDIDKKIDAAINICNGGRDRKVKFNRIYPFTTENISGYIDLFDLKDKSLFTVGSSGDQVFNASLVGCKDITLFDICPFTEEYFYLKLASIMLMTREELLDFFCYKNYPKRYFHNRKAFLESNFYSLLNYLENIKPEVVYFWTELLKRFKGRQIRDNLFIGDEDSVKILKRVNRYLESDEAYNLLRKRLSDTNITFKHGNIFKLEDDTKYDNVFLSNIATYCKLDDVLYMFYKMYDRLNDNGEMLVSYLYDTTKDSEYLPGEDEIYDLRRVFNTFPKELELYSFIGNTGYAFNTPRMKDSVLTYKKVKKI